MRKLVVLLLCCLALGGCGETKKSIKESTEVETVAKKKVITETTEEVVAKSKEDIFDDFKSEVMEHSKNVTASDEALLLALNYFEESYYDVRNLKEWPSDDVDFFTKFIHAISYLSLNFDDGSVGRDIGDKGWDAIKSLMLEPTDFIEKMDELKIAYEITGNNLYQIKYSQGQYKVGVDIPSGEYVILSTGGKGYFAVTSDSNGNDIIANENFDYNSIIAINDGEYLELSRSEAVPIDDVSSLPLDKANMFKIGPHLPAGEYKLLADSEKAYYCIYNDDRQDDIESNDNFSGQSYVTVSDGQYLLLSRCHIEQ